ERGLDLYVGRVACRVRNEYEAYALEVDEQRVGADVVGLERLGVERRRIVRDRREIAAVEHEVAADAREPGGAQRRDQRLELLDGDLRVAVSLEHEIARERRADQRTVGVR